MGQWAGMKSLEEWPCYPALDRQTPQREVRHPCITLRGYIPLIWFHPDHCSGISPSKDLGSGLLMLPFFSINFLLLGPGALFTTQVHTSNALGGREAASLHSHTRGFSGHVLTAVRQHWWGPPSTKSSGAAQAFVLQPQTCPFLPRPLRQVTWQLEDSVSYSCVK